MMPEGPFAKLMRFQFAPAPNVGKAVGLFWLWMSLPCLSLPWHNTFQSYVLMDMDKDAIEHHRLMMLWWCFLTLIELTDVVVS